jgi:hypothetical protein
MLPGVLASMARGLRVRRAGGGSGRTSMLREGTPLSGPSMTKFSENPGDSD